VNEMFAKLKVNLSKKNQESVDMIRDKYSHSCQGNNPPEIVYNEGSFCSRAPTADQQRIENILHCINLHNKTILHVGVGNSNIARLFGKQLTYLDGITVMIDEKEYADSLSVKNYSVVIGNKYSCDFLKISRSYDIIIDNNLSSFACCKHHFLNMFESYVNRLNDYGLLITDKVGLAYSKIPTSFAMYFHDLVELEKLFPIKVFWFDKNVIGLIKLKSRSPVAFSWKLARLFLPIYFSRAKRFALHFLKSFGKRA
jgi:hypothetical protein